MKIDLNAIPVETGTTYPAEFCEAVEGRSRQRVGNAAGLKNFGVNLTTLAPGSQSALRHWHSAQDEFVYMVKGELVLITDEGEQIPELSINFAKVHHNYICICKYFLGLCYQKLFVALRY